MARFLKRVSYIAVGVVAALGTMGCGGGDKPSDKPAPASQGQPAPIAPAALTTYTIDEATWDSEIYDDHAIARFRKILAFVNKPGEMAGSSELKAMLAPDFAASSIRPPETKAEKAYQHGQTRVLRWKSGDKELTHRGVEGLAAALTELRSSWPAGATARVYAKDVRIEAQGDTVFTEVYYELYSRNQESALQQTGKVECGWHYVPLDKGEPLLKWIRFKKLDEVHASLTAGQPLLVDATASLIGNLPAYQQQLRYGANHWITRLPQLKHRFHHGVAIGDVNADGLEDVFVCQPEGFPNLLLLRQPDGGVREAGAEAGIDFLDHARSALLIDLNNDGNKDLVLGGWTDVTVFQNDGKGRFTRKQTLPGPGQITSMCAADVDGDGLLDVYVCRYSMMSAEGRLDDPIPHNDAVNGAPNSLYRNTGGFAFEDVAKQVGLDHNNNRWSFAASWEDYDNDGDLDLYVANDYGRNNLYQRSTVEGKARFRDVAAEAGVEDQSFGMSVGWGDPNRDGLFDVYISNMYSSAGQRVTFRRNFRKEEKGLDQKDIEAIRYAALGNSLFQNKGDGKFDFVSDEAGVFRGQWAWSSNFLDVNNDGWEDLLVANGFITGPAPEKDL